MWFITSSLAVIADHHYLAVTAAYHIDMAQSLLSFSIAIKMPLVTGVGMLIPLLAFSEIPATPDESAFIGCSKATVQHDPDAKAVAIVRALAVASSRRNGEVLSGEERLLTETMSRSIRSYSLGRVDDFRVTAETYDLSSGQICISLVPIVHSK
jgi:hypothetical protein